MFYPFPSNLTLDEVTNVVREHNEKLGCDAFLRIEKDGYIIFNYVISFAETFPPIPNDDPVQARKNAILRECRGLTFSPTTGKVLARKYHKFFCCGQIDETQPHAIDWTSPHVILEKLDGSMLTPFRPDGSPTIRWATKMGLTDVAKPVEDFVAAHPHYDAFASECEEINATPIFEWCTRKQRIVIDYPEDKLVLTAVRDIETGDYCSMSSLKNVGEEYGIPVVDARPGSVDNITAFMEEARGLIDEEGYVVRFDNGAMVKMKAEAYCLIHGTKDHLQNEKNVLNTIFSDKMDDVIPFMDDADKDRINRFMADLEAAIVVMADRLMDKVAQIKIVCGESKKEFALSYAMNFEPFEKSLAFALWDRGNGVEAIKTLIKKNLGSSTRIEAVRHFFGDLKWEDYRDRDVVLDD